MTRSLLPNADTLLSSLSSASTASEDRYITRPSRTHTVGSPGSKPAALSWSAQPGLPRSASQLMWRDASSGYLAPVVH
jgi:hypothetical protein